MSKDRYDDIARDVFKLFLKGKSPAEVVAETGLRPEVVKDLYKKFCELNGPTIYGRVVEKFIAHVMGYEIKEGVTFEKFALNLIEAAKTVREKQIELSNLEERLSRHWRVYEEIIGRLNDLGREIDDIKRRVEELEERKGKGGIIEAVKRFILKG